MRIRGNANAFNKALLYVLVVSIVLLPIRFHFFKYVILLVFTIVCLNVLHAVSRKPKIPYSPVYIAIVALTFIYCFWALLSIYYHNQLDFIFKDSAGFLVYLVFPILFIYVTENNLSMTLGRSLIFASIIVAAIHIVVFVVFYATFGKLTFANLGAANTFISSLDFTWELGATGGILRANTKSGHYILMGIALLFYKFAITKRPTYLLLIGALFIGALFDGHKALIIATALFAILVAPVGFAILQAHPIRILVPFCAVVCIVVVTFALFLDVLAWWQRFGAIESSSFQVRSGQVESLIGKISERPVLGNGFGSYADVIRNEDRPFMYEVDFLAVAMKLGVLGAALYFLVYMCTIGVTLLRMRTIYGYTLFSLGLAYFFYMGTNGGFAMSPISSFFHVLLFLCVAVGLKSKYPLIRTIADRDIRPYKSSVVAK